MLAVRIAVLLIVLAAWSAQAWQFLGAYQTADPGCGACLTNNTLTHACGCPTAAGGSSVLRVLNDCTKALHGGDVAVCWTPTPDFRSAFGGVFQLEDAVPHTIGCRVANPATGACNCPFGFTEIATRALTDEATAGGGGVILGSTVVLCANTTAAASSASWFGGAFQALDSGKCAVANPFTRACTCPPAFVAGAAWRAIYDGPEGSTVTVCSPRGAPAPLPPSAAGQPIHIYVAVNGSDAAGNNGTSPLFPLATVGAALGVTADLIATHVASGRNVTIRVAAGVYYQPTTLQWPAAACGSRSQHTFVTLEAYPAGARVVLSGGTPVAGFTLRARTATADLYTARLNRSDFPQSFVWQLWRQSLHNATGAPHYTRVPLHARPTAQYTSLVSSTPPVAFVVPPDGALPAGADLADVFVYMYHSWTSTISAIASYDGASRTVTLQGTMPDDIYNAASDNRYRVVNLAEDGSMAPWTYRFNSSSFEIVLAVPHDAPAPADGDLVAPRLGTVLSIAGAPPAAECANVAVRGVAVAHTDSFLHEQCLAFGCSGQSGTFLSGAVVEVSNMVVNAVLEDVEVAHTGGYAVWLHEHTNSVVLARADIHDLGAGGVRVGEARSGAIADRSHLASNALVTDCRIHDGGYIIEAGTGVLLQQAASCTIQHNEIHQLYYTGVSTGWNWGYAPTSNNNILVRKNLIYDIGRGVLSDMGCVYNLGITPGSVVDNNVCHDVQTIGYGGWGYYSDEGTSYLTWQNNIGYRTKGAPYHQHYGEHNLVVNNVFAYPEYLLGEPYPDGGDFAGVRSSPAWSGPEHQTSFSLQRNIVLLRNLSATLFFASIPEAFINVTADKNVYYSDVAANTTLQFPCWDGKNSFAAWQQLGEDLHSVLQDPRFVDAAAYDFSRLQSDSPALALGFVPIDTSDVGPRK